MSKDYNVFLKNTENIKASDFESFAYRLGYFIRVCPLSDYAQHSGFLPFNVYLNFIDRFLPYDSFISGCEVYLYEYNSKDFDPEFDSLVENLKSVMMISVDGEDSLAEMTALVWAKYLCEFCGGVLYDPQTDTLFSDVSMIDVLMYEQKSELIKLSVSDSLILHEFKGWN